MSLHHVGIGTSDAAEAADRFRRVLGLEVAHEERIAERNLRVVFLGDGPYLELLEPTGPGPVKRFLERNGPGQHHVAVAVEDIEAALAGVEVERIDETARPGAWGHRVAFLHPDAMDGVLMELVEISE